MLGWAEKSKSSSCQGGGEVSEPHPAVPAAGFDGFDLDLKQPLPSRQPNCQHQAHPHHTEPYRVCRRVFYLSPASWTRFWSR